jgi:hypothetical protein
MPDVVRRERGGRRGSARAEALGECLIAGQLRQQAAAQQIGA